MTQAFTCQTLLSIYRTKLAFGTVSEIFSNKIFTFLAIGLLGLSISCKAKSSNPVNTNSEVLPAASTSATVPAGESRPPSGFPSSEEFIKLLESKPEYAGFFNLLHEDYLLKYVNVRPEYDFVFFVPNEKIEDKEYIKKYLSFESAPMDKLNFWLSHIAVSSKAIPFEGNPSIYQVMLKRNKNVISYEGGSANIVSEKVLKDGTQVIFIDQPFKINSKH
ncbi:MAG: hypothetical protein ABI851_09995 [Saprospiraceae bacterium]